MPTIAEWIELVNGLGPAIGVVAVVLGTVIAGWFQHRVAHKQTKDTHESQLSLLEKTHRQQMEILSLQHRREEDLRIKQFEESDRADRLVVAEYVDLLLPRLCEVASIYYLASDNKNEDELRRYLQLQRYMTASEVDAAHPESNLALRMTFLLFQLTAAMRLALHARWTRPLTDQQTQFLAHWEKDLEPILCSGRYPGKELLYREQLEILSAEMLITPEATNIPRPLNWKEFCEEYLEDRVLKELSGVVADKLRFIFEEHHALPPRKAMQSRLAIMALYLIQLSEEAGNRSWARRKDGLWTIVASWFKWEHEQGQQPHWFVFERGDVSTRAGVSEA